mgnify:FL=1
MFKYVKLQYFINFGRILKLLIRLHPETPAKYLLFHPIFHQFLFFLFVHICEILKSEKLNVSDCYEFKDSVVIAYDPLLLFVFEH